MLVCILAHYLEARILDDQVFQNIKRSLLYMVASRTRVMPCIETLKWILFFQEKIARFYNKILKPFTMRTAMRRDQK